MFEALITPSAICAWWGAAAAITLPEPGAYWSASWGESEDEPDYVTCARLSVFEPPHRLAFSDYRYYSKSGPPPFEAEFVTTFEVESRPSGCLLRVIQEGFPDGPEADDFYNACDTGWRDTFDGIRRFFG